MREPKRMQRRGAIIFCAILLLILTVTLLFQPSVDVTQHQREGYLFRGYFKFNQMGEADLAAIPGISKKQARLIYRRRDQFRSVDDFIQIKGIGPKKVEKIKGYIRF